MYIFICNSERSRPVLMHFLSWILDNTNSTQSFQRQKDRGIGAPFFESLVFASCYFRKVQGRKDVCVEEKESIQVRCLYMYCMWR
jgi:hypothetical protein